MDLANLTGLTSTPKQQYMAAMKESEDKIESLEKDFEYYEAMIRILHGLYFHKEEHEDFPCELQDLNTAIKYSNDKVKEIKQKIADEQQTISFCENMISRL